MIDLDLMSRELMKQIFDIPKVEDLLNLAESLLGNPMAVGRADVTIVYISKGIPKDSVLAQTGEMIGFNDEELLGNMDGLDEINQPKIIRHSNKVKYDALMSPLEIFGSRTGYLSILAVKREHSEEDIKAAELIRHSLEILFKLTDDPDFCPRKNKAYILQQLLQELPLSKEELDIILNPLQSRNGSMYVYSCKYRRMHKANEISRAAREELCGLLDSDLYYSTLGNLVIVSEQIPASVFEKLEFLARRYHLYIGISYPNERRISNIKLAYRQAETALEMTETDDIVCSLVDRALDHVAGQARNNYYLNGLVHPAAFMLWEYDQEHGTRLCETIIAYLTNGQSIRRTAEKLHLHVNTINQRFHQIENLYVGFKFCSDSLFDYYLSLLRISQ